MEISDVLFFDTETTGVPPRGADWKTDYEKFPHIVQIAWKFKDRLKSYIIRPDGWEVPEDVAQIHGITTERALAEGVLFESAITEFIADCEDAPLLCGHNIYFDTAVVKAEIVRVLGGIQYARLGVEAALHKGKRIDTMRPSMKWVDARMPDGRLKFPRLEELYSRCFPGETFPAHDAGADVEAVARCFPVLLNMGFVQLKVKEYPEEKKPEKVADPEKAVKAPNFAPNSKDDKLPIPTEKARQIENLGKITDTAAADLLGQNDF